jgi:predicted protein tyrosine phosphatase
MKTVRRAGTRQAARSDPTCVRLRVLPLQIVSRYRLEQMLTNNEKRYDHCISIADPGEARPQGLDAAFSSVLRLSFHDIDRLTDKPAEDSPQLPAYRHVRAIIRYARATNAVATGYTIHCHAGVHRSVAAGFMLLYLMHRDVSLARDELVRIKGLPLPNGRIMALFDRLTGAGLSEATEDLWRRLGDFLGGRLEIRLDDYLEELSAAD